MLVFIGPYIFNAVQCLTQATHDGPLYDVICFLDLYGFEVCP